MQEFQLQNGENLILTVKGNYWENIFLFLYEPSVGDIMITDRRILFFSRVFASSLMELEIARDKIESVEKCNVGSFVPWYPMGVKVCTKDGKAYKFSCNKRGQVIEALGHVEI